MISFFVVIHVILAVFLIIFILLQDSKGGALDGLSGQSKSVFGASGATNFLTNTTKWLSIFLAGTSLTLTYLVKDKGSSVLDQYKPPVQNSKKNNTTNNKLKKINKNKANKKDAKNKTK